MNNQSFQGGLWNSTRPNISNETQNLIKVMMQESKLTSFQRRTLTNTMKNGQSLPTRVAPDHTIVEKKRRTPKQESKIIDPRTHKTQLRNLDEIINSGAYEKSDYKPTPQRAITDNDKEHLGKIMAYGKDYEKMFKTAKTYEEVDDEPEQPVLDRFDELQCEINDRVEFLDSMTALGKRKQYESQIKTEISQKIREMELIDKKRTKELNDLLKDKTKDQ